MLVYYISSRNILTNNVYWSNIVCKFNKKLTESQYVNHPLSIKYLSEIPLISSSGSNYHISKALCTIFSHGWLISQKLSIFIIQWKTSSSGYSSPSAEYLCQNRALNNYKYLVLWILLNLRSIPRYTASFAH